MSPRIRRTLPLALLGLFLAVSGTVMGTATQADARQVEPAVRTVAHVRVTYVEHLTRGRAYVELNNGAAHRLRPCRNEDARRACVWFARERGNHLGRSFVLIHQHIYRIPNRLL